MSLSSDILTMISSLYNTKLEFESAGVSIILFYNQHHIIIQKLHKNILQSLFFMFRESTHQTLN